MLFEQHIVRDLYVLWRKFSDVMVRKRKETSKFMFMLIFNLVVSFGEGSKKKLYVPLVQRFFVIVFSVGCGCLVLCSACCQRASGR